MLRLATQVSSRAICTASRRHGPRVAAALSNGRPANLAAAPPAARPFGATAAAQLRGGSVACGAFGNVDVQAANEMVGCGACQYVDVRTAEEFAGGHAPGAVNIPVMNKMGPAMVPNMQFVQQFEAAFPNKSASLCIGCLSGKRSAAAAQMLSAAGYSSLQNVEGGYQAWSSAGLPVTK